MFLLSLWCDLELIFTRIWACLQQINGKQRRLPASKAKSYLPNLGRSKYDKSTLNFVKMHLVLWVAYYFFSYIKFDKFYDTFLSPFHNDKRDQESAQWYRFAPLFKTEASGIRRRGEERTVITCHVVSPGILKLWPYHLFDATAKYRQHTEQAHNFTAKPTFDTFVVTSPMSTVTVPLVSLRIDSAIHLHSVKTCRHGFFAHLMWNLRKSEFALLWD